MDNTKFKTVQVGEVELLAKKQQSNMVRLNQTQSNIHPLFADLLKTLSQIPKDYQLNKN